MRTMLNRLAIDGEIVIGEGEIDEAPMLYLSLIHISFSSIDSASSSYFNNNFIKK